MKIQIGFLLKLVLLMLVAIACNKSGSDALEDRSFGLIITKVSGDNQNIPVLYYSDPLIVKVSSVDGKPANEMKVTFSEVTQSGATVISPEVTVSDGIAQTRVISPQTYGVDFKIKAQIVGTNSSTIFTVSTTQQSVDLHYEMVTSNFDTEVADTGFSMNLYVRDELGDIVDINATVPIYINVASSPSWTGKVPTGIPSPTVPINCIFVSGHCSVPGSLNLKDARQPSLIWIGDGPGGVEDVAAKPITILPKPGSHLALTDSLGGPEFGATGFSSLDLNADEPTRRYYSAIVDTAGNYIGDASNVSVSSPIAQIYPYLTVDSSTGTVDFDPTKSTKGASSYIEVSKSGYTSSLIGVTVTAGVPSKFTSVINNGSPLEVGDWLDVKLYLTDKNENICENITDNIPLSLQVLEGQRPSGLPDLNLVNSDGKITNVGNNSWGDFYIGSDNMYLYSNQSHFFLQGVLFSPASIRLNLHDKHSRPALRFSTSKATFASATPDEPPITISTPPSSDSYDSTGNVINKINFAPPSSQSTPAYIIVRNPSTKVAFCRLHTNGKQYNQGEAPSPLPSYLDYPGDYCSTFRVSADTSPVSMEAYFIDVNGNDIDADPSTPERDPISISWKGEGSFNGQLSSSTGTTSTLTPGPTGIGALELTATIPNNSYFTNAGQSITTHIVGAVSTGEVQTFELVTVGETKAGNSYAVRFRALDRNGVWVQSFSRDVSSIITYSTVSSSPKGTAPTLPQPLTLTFVNGEAAISGIYTPKAQETITLNYSIDTGSKTFTGNHSWKVNLGDLHHLSLFTGFEGTGTDWTDSSFTIGMNDQREYSVFPTSFDIENNLISSSVPCTWTTQNVMSVNLTTSLQVTFSIATSSAKVSCTYEGLSAATGLIKVNPGPLNDIRFTDVDPGPYVAGEAIAFRLRMVDEWGNTIIDPAQGGNSTKTFSFYGNNSTFQTSSNATFPSSNITFTNGLSSSLSLIIRKSGVNSVGFIDQSNSNMSSSMIFNVSPDAPYKLDIAGPSNNDFTAGDSAGVSVFLQDQFGNIIESGDGANQQVSVTLTPHPTLDITNSSFLNSTSVAGVSDLSLTGNLNKGSGSLSLTSTKAGSFTLTVRSTADAGNIAVPTADPVSKTMTVRASSPIALQWKSGSVPASMYAVNNSSWSSFKAELIDTYGNVCTNISTVNSFTLTAEGAQKTLRGTTTVSPVAGVATFNDINYLLANDTFTLKASYTGVSPALEATQDVTTTVGPTRNVLLMFDDTKLVPGSVNAASALNGDQISTGSIAAGASYTIKAIATDAGFNKVNTYAGQITLTAPHDANASISPAGLVNMVNGERAFTVSHRKNGNSVSLTTLCTADSCTSSNPFNVDFSHPSPRRLTVTLPGQNTVSGVSTASTSCTTGAGVTQTAGVPFTVTVQATDDFCNPMTNSTSQVTLSAINDASAPAVAPSNLVGGAQSFTFENRTSGASKQILANLSPSSGYVASSFASSPYSVNANSAVAVNSSLTVTSTVVANNSSLATITITLKDNYNNPVPGQTPVVTIGGTGNTVVQGCSVSNTSGVSTCTFRSTKAEVKAISVTSPVTKGPVSSTFIAGAAVAVNSSIAGTGPVTADGVASSTISITLMDTYNNPVPGIIPTFSATNTASANTYSSCSTSDANGSATCTLKSTKAESKTPSILTPVVKTGAAISFVHGPATKLVYSRNPSTSNTAGVAFLTQPIVQVWDQFDNLVSNAGIDASASGSITLSAHSGSCAGAATSTVLSGTTTVTATAGAVTFSGINHTKAETIYIKASSGALTSACSPALVINANSPVAANSSFVLLTDGAIADNTATNLVRVTLKDDYSNPVPSITPALSVAAGTSTTVVGCSVSDTNGISNCTIKSTKAETKSIAIATPASLGSLPNVSMSFVHGAAQKLSFSAQPSSTAVAGTAFSTQPVLQVLDAYNNLVTSSTDSITLSAYTNSSCSSTSTATLQGVTTLNASSGAASFTGLNHLKAEGLYLKATSGTLTTACSSLVNVSHASVDHLAFTTQPSSSATAGVNFSTQPVVTIYDAYNNVATSAASNVTFSAVSSSDCTGPANDVLLGNTSVAPVSGVATATNLNYDYAQTIKLKSTYGGISACSNAITVSPAAASGTYSTISGTDNVIADGVATSIVSVTLKDAYDNPIPGSTPTLAVTGTFNSSTCSTPTDSNGQTTCTISSTKAETKTVTLNPTIGISDTVVFVPGAAAKLSFSTQPSTAATAGVSFARQPVVQILDAYNNLVTASSDTVALASFTNSGCTATSASPLAGTTSLAAIAGAASFSGINHRKAELLYIQASSGSLTTACSSAVTINSASPDATNSSFAILSDGAIANNSATNSVRITLKDSYNNPVPSITPTLTLVSGSNTTIIGCSVSDASGISDCTVTSSKAEAKSLKINTPSALSTLSSVSMTFVAGSASKLAYSTQPSSSVIAGAALAVQPVIQVLDEFNNLVTSSSDTVTLSAFTDSNCNSSSSATLQGTSAMAANSGVAGYTNISHNKAENLYIKASASGLTSACSGLITVSHAPVDHLAFTIQPSTSATAGVVFSTQPVVKIYDVYNNLASSESGVLTFSSTATDCSSAANAALQGTTSVTASSGVVSASNLKHNYAETIKMKASYGSLTVCSNTVTVNSASPAGANSSISASDNVTADGISTSNVSITLRDGFNNPVPDVTPVLSITGSAHSYFCPTPTDATGQTVCTITSTKAETKTVSLNPDLGISDTALFTPGAPSKLSFSIQPGSNATAGVTFGTQPSVKIYDAFDNLVTTATDTIVLESYVNAGCSSPSSSALGGTNSLVATSGTASFSDIEHAKAETLYLRASSGSLSTACSTAVTVSAAAPDHIAFTTQPSTTATAGVVFSTQPAVTIYDAYNNVVTNASGSLTFSAVNSSDCSSASAASLQGTTTTTPTSGTASGVGLKYNVAETIKLRATFSTFTTCSNSIEISPNVPVAENTSFGVDGSAVADGTDTITVTVTLRDAYNNPVNGQTLSYTVTSNTDVSALACSDSGFNGEYYCLISSTKAEDKVFDLLSPVIKSGPTLSFIPGPADASKSTLSLSSDTVEANGSAPATASITLRDANNNMISGATVAISVSPVTNVTLGSCTLTDSTGVATCTFTSTKAEVKTTTLTTPNLPSVLDTVTFVPGPAADAYSSVSATSPILADNTESSTISVHFADANNNIIPGTTPVLTGLDAADLVSCGTTDSNGNTTCSFRTSVAGTRILGFSTPNTLAITTTLTVNPNEAKLQRNDSTSTDFVSGISCGSSDSKIYTFINDGFIDTGILTVTFSDDADWDISDTCSGANLTPSGTCSVTVTFNCGQAATSATNVLTVSGTATNSDETINLSGSR